MSPSGLEKILNKTIIAEGSQLFVLHPLCSILPLTNGACKNCTALDWKSGIKGHQCVHWTTAFAFQADPLWVQGQTLARYWMLSSATSEVQLFFYFPAEFECSLGEVFSFILSSIFKHWLRGYFKWERNGSSARYWEGNWYPQPKHSHPQKIAWNPNNWLWSPKE